MLIGVVDHQRKVILIVDALPPPSDSISANWEFTRGIKNLPEMLQEVATRTGGMVRYLGEWHTHPSGHRASPSSVDIEQLQTLRSELLREVFAGNDGYCR